MQYIHLNSLIKDAPHFKWMRILSPILGTRLSIEGEFCLTKGVTLVDGSAIYREVIKSKDTPRVVFYRVYPSANGSDVDVMELNDLELLYTNYLSVGIAPIDSVDLLAKQLNSEDSNLIPIRVESIPTTSVDRTSLLISKVKSFIGLDPITQPPRKTYDNIYTEFIEGITQAAFPQ